MASDRLDRAWFARPATEVAPDLLGHELLFHGPDGWVGGVIVETEAYHQDDPASHTFRGRSARNGVMFGPGGHAYVYFTYGMHHCLNIVTGADGVGEAVLIRALEPTAGIAAMQTRRRTEMLTNLCSGPAKVTQALELNLSHNGLDLTVGPMLITAARRPVAAVLTSPRIGISTAQDKLWRFFVAGSSFVSASRQGVAV